MAQKRAQATLRSSVGRTLEETPRNDAAGSLPLGRRIFSLRNIVSVFLTLGILYLVSRQVLGFDWGDVWVGVRGASLGLFALAFAAFYCTFPVRTLRWKALLGNVGYGRADRRAMPSSFGLTRIMYASWFANCVTVARLGDAYRGYLLKKEAGVSFAVTLGTVLAERLLDLLVMAAMMGAGVLVVTWPSFPTRDQDATHRVQRAARRRASSRHTSSPRRTPPTSATQSATEVSRCSAGMPWMSSLSAA